MEKKFSKFSVPLGLLDYLNPILYTVTMVTILRNVYPVLEKPYNILLLIGVIVSVFFGLIIPTGKVLVGLRVIQFRMPVSLVFCVNTGILITGLMLFKYVMQLDLLPLILLAAAIAVLLAVIWRKTGKFNTAAVLTGAAGYVLIYTSLIMLSARKGAVPSVVLYALAILLFVMLCGIGIKADLKNPKVHWVIEISNVLCQLFLTVATLLLFS